MLRYGTVFYMKSQLIFNIKMSRGLLFSDDDFFQIFISCCICDFTSLNIENSFFSLSSLKKTLLSKRYFISQLLKA